MEIDGHDPAAIGEAFTRIGQIEQPLGIVARTVKGWGVSALQKGNWHGKPLKEADLPAAYENLDKTVPSHAEARLGRPTIPAEPAARDTPRPDPHRCSGRHSRKPWSLAARVRGSPRVPWQRAGRTGRR